MSQLSTWLRRAVLDELRELDGKWEPMRRDGIPLHVSADITGLRGMIDNRRDGHSLLVANLFHYHTGGEFEAAASIESEKQSINEVCRRVTNTTNSEVPVLLCWGNRVCSNIVADGKRVYSALKSDVEGIYGINALAGAVSTLSQKLFSNNLAKTPLVVVLAVPRPKPLQGSEGHANSNYELIPYVLMLESKRLAVGKTAYSFDDQAVIYPAQLREKSGKELLQRLSGHDFPEQARIHLVGCGSVGSKLAMHLGKAGFGNFDLLDKQVLQPHNLARMGVMTDHRMASVLKRDATYSELGMLGLSANVVRGDFVHNAASAGAIACHKDTLIVFDATASQTVHDALVNFPIEPAQARVMQGAFYAQGNVAMLALEGEVDRKPDLEDLEAHFWRWWMRKKMQGELEWPGKDEEDLRRIQLGEGCGSLTMKMSDMQASLLTAGMAQRVAKHLSKGMEDAGELSIARIDSDDGMGVSWEHMVCTPSTIVEQVDGDWEVRILPDVAEEIGIQAEVARAEGLETGGYLMGTMNPVLRRITISAHLPAPEDSQCTASVCVLGNKGAKDALLAMHEASRKSFLALGTWHSHPNGGDASNRDWETLQEIAKDFHGLPAISLIWRPDDYMALVRQKLD